jgi:hypothetical protein
MFLFKSKNNEYSKKINEIVKALNEEDLEIETQNKQLSELCLNKMTELNNDDFNQQLENIFMDVFVKKAQKLTDKLETCAQQLTSPQIKNFNLYSSSKFT